MALMPRLKIAAKLPLALIGSALVVGLGIGAAAYVISLRTVDAQRVQSFEATLGSAVDKVNSYLDGVRIDLVQHADWPDTFTQIDNMMQIWNQQKSSNQDPRKSLKFSYVTNKKVAPQWQRIAVDSVGAMGGQYDAQHKRFHPAWRSVIAQRGYEDVLLFSADKVLIYTAQKNEDLGTDFKDSADPLTQTALAKLLDKALTLKRDEIAFTDFTVYAPSASRAEAFMAAPVFTGDTVGGVLMYEISAATLSTQLQSIRGLGKTGEVIVVGSDGLMRTQSRFSQDNDVLATPLQSDIVTGAIGGQTASGVVPDFKGQRVVATAAPLQFGGIDWAVVAMQSEAEVFAPVSAMRDWMMMVGGGLLLLAAAVGLLFARSVSKPLTRLTETMQTLAGGELGIEVKGADRKDEIGDMARTVEVFRENMVKVNTMTEEERAGSLQRRAERTSMMQALQESFGRVVDAAVRGDFSQRVDSNFADPELNAIAGSINNLVAVMGRGLADTGAVLSALARTDLTKRVEGDYEGAFLALKNDTNAVAEKIAAIVGQLRETSRNLKTATGEILSGANDLSERTTKQAATIEETSAAMEHLANTVLENAKRANEASDAAATVTRTAEEGGTVMGQATEAMERITQSSGKISNIIGLIDDIAFQTNLLALNASVEAARAGEAGKGFAVVAVEVRRLAQSAAQASNEVKALIEQSGKEVKTGSKYVADAASKLAAMLTGARATNEMMNGIAHRSRDQAHAIEEVSAAVRQMDEMTQHNAALVEETNAAIEHTESQAVELDKIVEVFTLSDAMPVETSAPARAPAAAKPRGIKALQNKVKSAAKSYLSRGNAAVDTEWSEF